MAWTGGRGCACAGPCDRGPRIRETPECPNPAEIRLTGHGLVLREWTEEDLGTMVELFDDPDVAYRTPLVSPFDLAAARAYLQKARRARAEGRGVHLAITADGQKAQGEVMLNRSIGSLGYAVGRPTADSAWRYEPYG